VQTCPVPLPSWLSDAGGKGIQILTVTHGTGQLRSRWQHNGAQVILDTCGTQIWLPGITDTDTLDKAGKLCGQAALYEHPPRRGLFHDRGEEQQSRVDVMSPDMIRQLPEGRALVVRGSLAPTVAKLPRAWKSRQYRQARRRGLAVAVLTPAPSAARPSTRPTPTPQPETVAAAAHHAGPAAHSTRPHLHLVTDDADAQVPDGRDDQEEAFPPGDYPWSPQ
jgi:type IV secretory pathway TraG/TraD family ATPase VirD4